MASAHLAHWLGRSGCHVLSMPDPFDDLRAWFGQGFDVALVNPFRGAADPVAAISLMRGIAGTRPLVALTLGDRVDQRILAIGHGADDAIDSAHPLELSVRIAALLRRRAIARATIACDDLSIDLLGREVRRAGRVIAMPRREFDVLSRLATTPDCPVSRGALLKAVWRLDFDPGTNSVEVHMSRLRSRIDAGQPFAMLRTIKGIGYALVSRAGALSGLVPGLAPGLAPVLTTG